jgi:hypothetical protein
MTVAFQARAYYRRRRRKSHVDPSSRLFRVATIASGTTPIDTATLFGDSVQHEVAFALSIRAASSSATGTLFQFGDEELNVNVWVQTNGRLGFVAGRHKQSIPVGTQLWTRNQTRAPLNLKIGKRHDIVMAIRPGTGEVRLWRDGQMLFNQRASGNSFGAPVPPRWAESVNGEGSYFAAPAHVAWGALFSGAPNADLEALSPLSVYHDQRPRHFNTGPKDTPT